MASIPTSPIVYDLHVPRYAQVYSIMQHWIRSGVYPAGARLPSESELCVIFNVSRITLRNAVNLLVGEKLVERLQGRGTFVVEDLASAPNMGDMDQLLRKLRRLSSRTTLDNIVISEINADPAVAKDLGLEQGAKVLRASFTRVMDQAPLGYTELFFPADLGVEITAEDLIAVPSPTVLESKGFEILGADQVIAATLADSHLANLLQTQVGSPLVRIRMLVFEKHHRPIQRLDSYYRADHYEHHTFLSRSAAEFKKK